jgi:hypothetical protein
MRQMLGIQESLPGRFSEATYLNAGASDCTTAVHTTRKLIYESAASVKPKSEPLAAPMAPPRTDLDTLRPSRPEDMARLESDLSAAPEAEMGSGNYLEPLAFSLDESFKHLCTKAVNSGVWGGTPGNRSCRCDIHATNVPCPFARKLTFRPTSHLSAFLRHEHLRPGCRNQKKGLSKMANHTARLPVQGRRDPSLIRLAIGLPFRQYPPTGLGQVAGDRDGRFPVSFGSPQPLI